MNDLAGLDWNSAASAPNPQRTQSHSQAQYSAFKAPSLPSIPRQSTPLSAQTSGATPKLNPRSNGSFKAQGHDSFASLLGPSVSKTPSSSVTLQERQKQLLAEKAKQPLGQAVASNVPYHATDAHFWEGLGSGRGTPTTLGSSSKIDEDDLLAAFNSSAPVDVSSHFPPPAPGDSRSWSTSPEKTFYSNHVKGAAESGNFGGDHDDDPFGLNHLAPKRLPKTRHQQPPDNDDDILGMLGRPISEMGPRAPVTDNGGEKVRSPNSRTVNARDKALAELVDMGFPAARSREALSHTDDGLNVQDAVGWLLNQAHEESRSKSKQQVQESRPQERGRQDHTSRRAREEESADAVPQWMRREEAERGDSRSPAASDKDVTHYAAEIGVSFLKTANSLWKTGQKRVQKVVTELQYESDGSQPKWMRDAQQSDSDSSLSKHPIREQKARAPLTPDVTDEAMMLEGGRGPPKRTPKSAFVDKRLDAGSNAPARHPSPLMHSNLPEPPASRPQMAPAQGITRAANRVSRQLVEEQSAEAYVSPARRRKAADSNPLVAVPDMDIFASSQPVQDPPRTSHSSRSSHHARPETAKPTMPIPIRPKAPSRPVPSLSLSAQSISATKRAAGSASFKRGDYAEALGHYTAALSPLPPTHPIAIVVRCNRALTNIKVGDPKAAIADADTALEIIGPSHGEDETIFLGDTEGNKPMKEFFSKALSRKAEALEAMEKWSDAAKVWREAVEAGVGGSVAIQGRNRCEKASGTGSAASQTRPVTSTASLGPATAASPRKVATSARPLALNGHSRGQPVEAEAVKRLREANAAAAAASDEAFALTDVVDARLTAWKGGKSDNLRALLASLDSVLWPEAGWKKVGMADLVMPPRVKIIYMKAIAKVHPDKIAQTATTEQKMISSSVFAALNEAWDKFKKDNGL